MILTGKQILEEINNNNIKIEPFNEKHINPNSYDISLGTKLFYYDNNVILDSNKTNNVNCIEISEDGYILEKNKFYYAETLEEIYTPEFVPMLHSKSGVARIGLFVHITADLLDIGHNGKILLQIYPTNAIKIYPKQRIGQISFWKIKK